MSHSNPAAAVLVALSLLLTACSQAPAPAAPEVHHEHKAQDGETVYQCPMHPEVRSDEPGRCPICGMDLVPMAPAKASTGERKPLYYRNPMNPSVTSPSPRKDEMGMDYVPVYAEGDDAAAGDDEAGAIRLSAAMVNNLGVRTAATRMGKLDSRIDTVGILAYDERGRIEVRVRAEGYVERLSVRAEGEAVRRGQALFAAFSPKLAAAQREFLNALALDDAALIEASAGRLRALGLDAAAIERLRTTGKVAERVTYYAPEDGVVTSLGIREGALAEPGMSAMTVVPTSRLWVVAEVPEADAARVHAGASATLAFPALPGETMQAQVLEVLPQLNEATRTLQARLELANPGRQLAAGMLADVSLEADAGGEALMVPTEALIRTGRAERVIVALGNGRFVARDVLSGRESGDEIQVLAGLEPGEEVVVSGQFMIDSESQVRSSLRRYDGPSATTDMASHGQDPMQEQGK
jgi:Cu(I)/Ag(I) efflux system membrane fusion protein